MGQLMYQQVNLFPQNEYVKMRTFIFFSEQLSPRSQIKMLIGYASSLFPTSHSWLRMDSAEFQKQQAGESGGDFLRYFH